MIVFVIYRYEKGKLKGWSSSYFYEIINKRCQYKFDYRPPVMPWSYKMEKQRKERNFEVAAILSASTQCKDV